MADLADECPNMKRCVFFSHRKDARTRRAFFTALYQGAQYVLMLERNTVEADCAENELMLGMFAVCGDVRYADGRPVSSHSSLTAVHACWRFFEQHLALWEVPQPHAVGSSSWSTPLSAPSSQAPYRKQLKTVNGELRACEYEDNGYSLLAWERMPNPVPQSRAPLRLQSDLFLLDEFRGYPALFRAVDKTTGTVCVFKQVYRIGAGALAREAQLLTTIPLHPHVVQLHGLVGSPDGMVDGILLTYIPGRSLDQVADATAAQRAKWIRHLRATLNFLHRQVPPAVWGDVKPANVVIHADDDRAMLIDFGGSCTPGWVDRQLAETRDGDEQGFARLVAYIDRIGVAGEQGAPAAAAGATGGAAQARAPD